MNINWAYPFQKINKWIQKQLKLHNLFKSAKQAEIDSKIKPIDTLNIKIVYVMSNFFLLNINLYALYFIFKKQSLKKSMKLPLVGCGFGLAFYKLSFEWVHREILRQLENQNSDCAYYFRNQLIRQFSDNNLIKFRLSRLHELNKTYEKINSL